MLQDHILRGSGVSGMDSDLDRALADLRAIIPDFDLSGFANKNTVPPTAQHALASALFSNIVQEMEVRFSMTCRHKAVLGMPSSST